MIDNNNNSVEEEYVEEYVTGEIAPSIVTSSKIWKPEDLKTADSSIESAIMDLVKNCENPSYEAAERLSVLRVWEARNFDNGFTHLVNDNGGWSIAGVNTKNKNNNAINAADDQGIYPTNIYSSQGDIITSALCRGQIKINFSPVKSKEPSDVQTAKEANNYKHLWYATNDSMGLQRQIANLSWTDPRVLLWTRSVKDKAKFSSNSDDPEDIKTVQITTAHGSLESGLPMMADTLSGCSYARITEELDYAIARASYPWMKKKIKASGTSSGIAEFKRLARINTRIGIMGKFILGTSTVRDVTIDYTWNRPGSYYDDKISDKQRNFLLENFPKGIFTISFGDTLICCWEESMDDHLSLGLFCRGFGQNRRALGSSDIPIVKRVNNWSDLYDKLIKAGIPSTLIEGKILSDEALAELNTSTTRFIPVAIDTEAGQHMSDIMGQTPTPTPLPGFAEMIQWCVGPLIQSLDGGTPALFGQAGDGADTVGGTQIRLQQALERIGPVWIVTNRLFSEALSQAVKCCADAGETVFGSVENIGDVSVNPDNLKGNFKVISETINSIPESGTQREAKVMMILDMASKDPQVASLVGTPSNAREIVNALHISDVLSFGEADWEDCALEDIETLVESEPLLNTEWQKLSDELEQLSTKHEDIKNLATQAVQSGNILPDEIVQQGQLMANNVNKLQEQLNNIPKLLPSVPVAQDDSEDHATIVATVFDWMGKDEGRSLRRKARNISPDEQDVDKKKPWNSWNNVFLYWSGHKEVMHKLIDEGKQVTPPKISMTGKIPSSGMAQLLNAAGIQVDPNSIQEPADEETEIIQRTPYNETKKTTTRKIS